VLEIAPAQRLELHHRPGALAVGDGDGLLDSTALVDNFQWIANGGTVVVGTVPVPTPK
jgi:hypothetical protein